MRESTRRQRKPTYKSCSFTGHRPQKLPFGENERDPRCVAFKQDIHDVIENLIGQGFARFVSGGARGFDTFAAEAVLDLKENYPWISLEMVSPYDEQAACWNKEDQMRHERLFAAADVLTATGHEYTKGCLFRRNRYLVDTADMLLAAYNGQSGGTAMTVSYAHERGVPVQVLAI